VTSGILLSLWLPCRYHLVFLSHLDSIFLRAFAFFCREVGNKFFHIQVLIVLLIVSRCRLRNQHTVNHSLSLPFASQSKMGNRYRFQATNRVVVFIARQQVIEIHALQGQRYAVAMMIDACCFCGCSERRKVVPRIPIVCWNRLDLGNTARHGGKADSLLLSSLLAEECFVPILHFMFDRSKGLGVRRDDHRTLNFVSRRGSTPLRFFMTDHWPPLALNERDLNTGAMFGGFYAEKCHFQKMSFHD
jgi:hypothetical protein